MSKNDPKLTQLEKYDVDANIEEVQSDDEISVFTYKFTALSNPKNVRLSISGTAQISGDTMERDEILENDDEGIPKLLTVIYQELFPTFFLLSKTLNVSCPPHQIGQMGSGVDSDMPEEDVTEPNTESEIVETVTDKSETDSIENHDITQPNV
jgi:hypothetical protein